MSSIPTTRLPLHDRHVAAGARFASFAGFESRLAGQRARIVRALQHANRLQKLEIRAHLPLAHHHCPACDSAAAAEFATESAVDRIWECVLSAIEYRKKTLVNVSLSMIKFCDDTLMRLFNILAASTPPTSIQTVCFHGTAVTANGFFEAPGPGYCGTPFDDALFVDGQPRWRIELRNGQRPVHGRRNSVARKRGHVGGGNG
jgi:hypothetical protein